MKLKNFVLTTIALGSGMRGFNDRVIKHGHRGKKNSIFVGNPDPIIHVGSDGSVSVQQIKDLVLCR